MDRQETNDDNGDDRNPDDDVDDIDESEEDVEIDASNELDESGRDDDDDMDGFDDGNISENIANDEDIKDDDAQSATVMAKDAVESSLVRIDERRKGPATSMKPHPRKGMKGPRGGGNRKRNSNGSNGISSRAPSVRGLTIPFRTIKKSMKIDPDIPIVQNEAAIMATVAVELFLKRLVTQSHRNAKNRGRNTVRYEDVAEARTNDKALAFLEILLP